MQKVAPWLTVDGDAYPAVVDGRVKWILDGYTTTDHYPNSQKDSLRAMTADALSPNTTYATLPTDEINYMRNSVKAVVDAYDGTVTLYEWDADPIVKAWSEAFPGIVKPRSEIPPDLLDHMRYPEDLFKVQRNMLAQYHVTNPKTFYDGSDQWNVPEDPENQANKQPPYRLSVQTPDTGNLAGVLADQRLRAATSGRTSRRSSPSTRTPSRDGLRQDPDPAAARATRRCPGRRRSRTSSARTTTSRTSCWRSRRRTRRRSTATC